jgi:hypothetical protein
MKNRVLTLLSAGILATGFSTTSVIAQNVFEIATVDVGMLYVHAWDTHGPGLEARLGFALPEMWLGLRHEVALAAQMASTHGTVSAIGPYDRSFATGGVEWRSTLVNLGRNVRPYVLVPMMVARSGLDLEEEFQRAYLSSTMEYRDLPSIHQRGTHWGLCVGLGSGLELDVTRFLHFDLSGTLMYPTLFEDRRLIKTVRLGLAFGGGRG